MEALDSSFYREICRLASDWGNSVIRMTIMLAQWQNRDFLPVTASQLSQFPATFADEKLAVARPPITLHNFCWHLLLGDLLST